MLLCASVHPQFQRLPFPVIERILRSIPSTGHSPSYTRTIGLPRFCQCTPVSLPSHCAHLAFLSVCYFTSAVSLCPVLPSQWRFSLPVVCASLSVALLPACGVCFPVSGAFPCPVRFPVSATFRFPIACTAWSVPLFPALSITLLPALWCALICQFPFLPPCSVRCPFSLPCVVRCPVGIPAPCPVCCPVGAPSSCPVVCVLPCLGYLFLTYGVHCPSVSPPSPCFCWKCVLQTIRPGCGNHILQADTC